MTKFVDYCFEQYGNKPFNSRELTHAYLAWNPNSKAKKPYYVAEIATYRDRYLIPFHVLINIKRGYYQFVPYEVIQEIRNIQSFYSKNSTQIRAIRSVITNEIEKEAYFKAEISNLRDRVSEKLYELRLKYPAYRLYLTEITPENCHLFYGRNWIIC
jgi:regulator of replication initiation timing